MFLFRSMFVLWLFCALSAAAFAGRIPIQVDRYLPDHRSPAPVTFGVPFPRGALAVGQPIAVLNAQNQPVAVQTSVAATWDPRGKQGVRWLHVDFQTEKDQQYTLVFGDDLPQKRHRAGRNIALDNGTDIVINTGALKGRIRKAGFDLFTGLTANNQPIVQRGRNEAYSGFFMKHEKHGLLRADLDTKSTVVLEQTGPLRATIKADGWYVNKAGERFGRYSIRATFFRERMDIKLDHTWIYTGLSSEDVVTDIGIQLNMIPTSYESGYLYWGAQPIEEGVKFLGVGRKATPHASLVQDAPKRDHIEYRMIDHKTGQTTHTGGKAGGWCVLYARPIVLTAVIRDAWQQYPWEFELDDRIMRIHLWPKHGRKMDLTWDGYWHFLNEEQKRHLAENKYHREKSLDDWVNRLRTRTNATGAAKTHEVWLSFVPMKHHEFQGKPVGAQLAREVAYPVIARSDPAWNVTTGALDFCQHVTTDDPRFKAEQNYQRALLHMMQSAVAQRKWYGWWDWGGYHQHLLEYKEGQRELNAGLGKWHRARPKSHYGWGMFPWLNIFRGGDRDWLRYGETYTRYSADRAMCHHTDHGRVAGAEYHYDNSEVHWLGGYIRSPGGDMPSSNLQQKDDYVYKWWLTGDRRALDVLEMWGEQISQHEKWLEIFRKVEDGNMNRNCGMLLHRMCMLYQATWDERFLKYAGNIADAFAKVDTIDRVREIEVSGDHPWHASSGWVYEGLWLYWNLTADKRIRKTLEAYCHRASDYNAGAVLSEEYAVGNAFTYGYQLTKDPKFLYLGRALADRLNFYGLNTHSFSPSVKGTNVTFGRLLGTLGHAPQTWRDEYLPTDQGRKIMDFRYLQRRPDASVMPATVYFNEPKDGDWSFDAVFTFGGDIVVYRPDGKIAARKKIDRLQTMRVRFDIPSDNQTGTYTLACLKFDQSVHKALHPTFQATALIYRSDLRYVAQLPNQTETLPVRARTLFFNVPANTDAAAIRVGPMYRDKRKFTVTQIDGNWAWHSDEHVVYTDGSYRVALPRVDVTRTYAIQWDTPARTYFRFNEGSTGTLRFENILPVVAANPQDLFVPKPAKRFEKPAATAESTSIDELLEMP